MLNSRSVELLSAVQECRLLTGLAASLFLIRGHAANLDISVAVRVSRIRGEFALIQQASGFSSITVTAESSLWRSRQFNYFRLRRRSPTWILVAAISDLIGVTMWDRDPNAILTSVFCNFCYNRRH